MFYSLDTVYTLWFIFRKMLLKSAVRSVYSQVKSLSRPLNISPRQNFLLHERPAINCMAIFDSSLNPFAIEGPDSDLWVASKMLNTPAAQ